jgi:hypothetical protein
VNRLMRYLRDERRYSYSLELPDTRGKLPLDAFLFDVKRGHCEYFSSALAVMLRAVGIPARNVTGFLGGEYNPYGGYYGVRQADAHSWVEALLPGRGWVVLDPTPASRDGFNPSSLFSNLRAMADAMRAYWMTRVVGYDLRGQVRALRELRDFFRSFSWSSGEKAEPNELGREGASKFTRGPLLLAAMSALVIAIGLFALVRWRRKRHSQLELRAAAREAQRMYRQLERLLEKDGHARPAHVTPEAHARALSESGYRAAGAVNAVTEAYVGARYGTDSLDAERLRALKARLRELERAA